LPLSAAVLMSACGGAQPEPAPARPVRAQLLPEDQAFTSRLVDIQGIAFVPEALGLPSMPRATVRGRPTLERQRARAARQRSAPEDVQVLVTLLWDEAGRVADGDPERATALREEARTALRSARSRTVGSTDALTLQMLASAEMWLGDDGSASAAFEELVSRFPDHDERQAMQIWLAYLHLRQHRKEVVELVRDWKPDELGDVGSYVLAWAGLASGDATRARRAITSAVAAWKDASTRPAVERDLVLILARTGTDVAEAARLVGEAAGGDARRRHAWMFRLSEAYKYAGNYDAAARVLDVLARDPAGGEARGAVARDDLVGFRHRQADYAFRLNRPAEAAERAIQAQAELVACKAECPETTARAVHERMLKLAQFFHTAYARSLDPAHHDAAVALYRRYLAIPGRPDAQAARGYLSSLEETRATSERGDGKHDEEVLLNFFWARREVVAACYEAVLLGDPRLDGSLELTLEIDARGAVTRTITDPRPGDEGMAAVAACLTERTRRWTFPSRTVPGETTLTVPLQLRLQQAQPLPDPESAAPAGS
jgi:hypothetical protein